MRLYRRSTSWWVTYMVDNQRYRTSTGTKRREEAQAFMSKLNIEIFEGRHFPGKKQNSLTVEEMGSLWLETKGREKKSRSDDEQRYRSLVAYFGANKRIAAIRPQDVDGFVVWLRSKTTRRGKAMAPATINHHLTLMWAALNNAAANGHEGAHTAKAVRLLPMHNERDRICTEAEYRRLIEHAYPKLRFCIVLGHWTGMRLNEFATLTWKQIDRLASQLSLHASQTKTGKGRTVPLAPEPMAEITTWPQGLEPVSKGLTLQVS